MLQCGAHGQRGNGVGDGAAAAAGAEVHIQTAQYERHTHGVEKGNDGCQRNTDDDQQHRAQCVVIRQPDGGGAQKCYRGQRHCQMTAGDTAAAVGQRGQRGLHRNGQQQRTGRDQADLGVGKAAVQQENGQISP